MAWIQTRSGIVVPTPALDSGKTTIATLVDGGRNSNGDFIGQVLGNDKLKIEMSWKVLTPEQFQTLLKIFDRQQGGSFVNDFRVFDPRVNDFVWKTMYVGDRSGRPFKVSPQTFRPEYWLDVQANLIEV